MPNWTWEPTRDGFFHNDDYVEVDVKGYDNGEFEWTSYAPISETASGFATADEAKADAERFFMMAEEE